MIERSELAARLALRALPGLRDAAINRLIAEHGSAQRAIRAGAGVGVGFLAGWLITRRNSNA